MAESSEQVERWRETFDFMRKCLGMASDELLLGDNPQEAANWLNSVAVDARRLEEELSNPPQPQKEASP